MSNEEYLGFFLGGLRDEIRWEVLILEPTSRHKAVSIARHVERKLIQTGVLKGQNSARRQSNIPGGGPQGRAYGHSQYRPTQAMGLPVKNDKSGEVKKGSNRPNHGVRNLTYQELMDRRAKGLCFKCGQNYSPMHQCSQRELRLMVWEGETEEDHDGEAKEEIGEWEVVCNFVEAPGLTTQSIISSKTMKLEGRIKGLPVLILIDSGSSHNFITKDLVTALNLPVTNTREFAVTLGDGSTRVSQGRCRGMVVSVGCHTLIIDAFILELGGLDMIWGVEWLETLGEIKSDWRKKSMSFTQDGQPITLQGYQKDKATQTTALQFLLKENDDSQLIPDSPKEDLDSDQARQLLNLLQQYQYVFQDPQGLPPPRDTDHAIVLQSGVNMGRSFRTSDGSAATAVSKPLVC